MAVETCPNQTVGMGKILVVDDEPHICELVTIVLSDDHDVVAAEDAPAALGRLHEERFDVVVLDYLMPEFLGSDLGPLIRRIYPEVAIVGFSAVASSATTSEGEWADEYLDKGDLQRLSDAVTRILILRSREHAE